MMPKLIASDIDGTLITSAERVTPRLKAAVMRASKSAEFVLATGRPPRWIPPVVEQLSVSPLCLCSNGAIIYDSDADRVIATTDLDPAAQRAVIDAVAGVVSVGVAVERAGQSAFDAPEELFAVTPDFSHAWISSEHGVFSLEDVISQPAVKLLLRNPTLSSAELFEAVAPVVPAELAHVTYSMGDGLLEVSAPTVNKATALAQVADIYSIDAADILAFGDMLNDAEMLQWAGWGVAMGNAPQAVKDIADEVTTTNDDFGVARVLERLFP